MSSTRSGSRWACTIAMFVAIVVVPTPPFGLNTATVPAPGGHVSSRRRVLGDRSLERWKRSSSASTRASSSRPSNGLAITSSAPASRKRIRSSTSSVWLTHRTGMAAMRRRPRISRQTSAAVLPPPTTSRMTSWCSATLAERLVGVGERVTV